MKKLLTIICAAILLMACSNEQQLKERAAELCQYIPDHELKEVSKAYMTPDFYNVLDTLFNHLPEHEAMDHEWLYYFVTGNGGTIADFEVAAVKQTDKIASGISKSTARNKPCARLSARAKKESKVVQMNPEPQQELIAFQ